MSRSRRACSLAVAAILFQAAIAPFGAAHAVAAPDKAGIHHAGIPHHHCGEHAQGGQGSTTNGRQNPPCCANGACQCNCPVLFALVATLRPLASVALTPRVALPASEPIDRGMLAPLLRPPIA
jgi:hypothetical protein